MNDLTNGHSNGHANGSNGSNGSNGNKGIFDLTAKVDPLLSVMVPSARKRVAVMQKLSFGARTYFCWLTDQSLTPGANITKGVLKISDHDAGVRFKVHSKTIRNWKRELEDTGEVWLTEKWMKNSFPQTVYNITAIVGQATLPMSAHSNDGSLVEDEVFSSNRRRQQTAKRDPATGMFARRFQTPPGVRVPEVSPEITQIQAENAPSGIILPSTTAMDCRPPRQPVAAHSGNAVPSPTATDCRPARQIGAVADGNAVPQWAAMGCRGERNGVADNGKALEVVRGLQRDKEGDATPRNEAEEDGDTGFSAWCESWKDEFRGKLSKELGRIRVKIQACPDPFWQRRASFLQIKLDGGKAPQKPFTAPVRSIKPASPALRKMDLKEARDRMAKAKAEAAL